MMQVTVDDDLRKAFNDFKQPLDLCDETGKVLAYLIPVRDSDVQKDRPPSQLGDEGNGEIRPT